MHIEDNKPNDKRQELEETSSEYNSNKDVSVKDNASANEIEFEPNNDLSDEISTDS